MSKQIMAFFMSVVMTLSSLGVELTQAVGALAQDAKTVVSQQEVAEEEDATEEMAYNGDEEVAAVQTPKPEHKKPVKKLASVKQQARRRGGENATADLVQRLTVTQDNKVVEDGSVVSYKKEFSMHYQLKDAIKMGFESGNDVEFDKYYELPKLGAGFFKVTGNKTIPVSIEGKTKPFGEVTIEEDGRVVLHVTYDDVLTDGQTTILGAYFEYKAQLVEDKVKDEMGEVIVPWPDGTTKKILIAENQPKEPTITKTGERDGDSINWTVTITNDENPVSYSEPILLTDTITMSGSGTHSYVDGSFMVNDAPALVKEWTKPGEEFTYEVTNTNPGESTVITYTTKAKYLADAEDLTKNGNLSQTVTNTATITASGEKALQKSAVETVSLTKNLENWITKRCTSAGKKIEYLTAENEGKLSWTITVKNNGYHVKDVVLHDLFGGDAFIKEHMTLDKSSVMVDGAAANVTEGEAGESFQIALPEMTGNETVVVTYDTYISSYAEFLRTNHTESPSNKAWLTFAFDFGGTGEFTVIPKGPEMVENVSITTKAGIQKEFVSFDATTHQLKWKVTVNKEYQPLQDVTVKELMGAGQKFVSFGEMTLKEEGGATDTYAIDESDYTLQDSTVTLTLGDKLKGKKATFEVTTELTEAEVDTWSGNVAAKVYHNRVELCCGDEKIAEDTAKGTYKSEVIKKVAGAYDYTNHTIDYTITVNQNKMPMDGVSVVDSWDKSDVKATLVESSVKLDGQPLAASKIAYEKDKSKVTFSLGSIHDEVTITYTLKVLDNDLFETNKAIKEKNSASFTSAVKTTAVVVSGTSAFNGKFLEKSYEFDNANGIATYTVVVNANRHKLQSKLALLDTMGDGLRYVKDSFKAYKGNVGADGTVTAEGAAISDITATAEKGKTSTRLTILFPQAEDDACYVLTYQAKAVPGKANYANQIERVGRESAEESVASTKALTESEKSGAWIQKAVYLMVKETDNVDKKPVKGVVYVVKNTDGEVVAELTSDGNKESTSIGELETGEKYYVCIKEVPDGYEMPEVTEQEVIIGEAGKSKGKTVEFELVRKEKAIKIQTVSEEQTEPLEGAKLTIREAGKDKILKEWTTDGGDITYEVPLKKEMVLIQTKNPTGFEKNETEVHFKLDYEDGQLKLFVKEGDSFKPQPEASLKVVNKMDESVKKPIAFVAVDDGTNQEISGGKYTLQPYTDKEAKTVIETWVKDENEKLLDFNYQRIYEVVENEPPAGYQKAEKKIVKIDNNGNLWELVDGSFVKTADNIVEMRNKKLTTGGGGGASAGGGTTPGTEPTPSGEPTSSSSTTPNEDNSGTTPSEKSNSTGPEAKPSNKKEETEDTDEKQVDSKKGTKQPTASVNKKKTHTSQKKKQEKTRAGEPRLAQTGGFLGTMLSYLVALLLIAIGCFVLRNESKKE